MNHFVRTKYFRGYLSAKKRNLNKIFKNINFYYNPKIFKNFTNNFLLKQFRIKFH